MNRFLIFCLFILLLFSFSGCDNSNSNSSETPDYELYDTSEDIELRIDKEYIECE